MSNQMDHQIPYVHPLNNNALELKGDSYVDPKSGELFYTVKGVPRFCDATNYSDSFGFQWNVFSKTQLDVISGAEQSALRFFGETDWAPAELENCSVLEVGSGAGRFSEVFLRTTKATLYSIDYSNAVEANWLSNSHYGDRFRLSQASIYGMPFADNSFDKIFCLGFCSTPLHLRPRSSR